VTSLRPTGATTWRLRRTTAATLTSTTTSRRQCARDATTTLRDWQIWAIRVSSTPLSRCSLPRLAFANSYLRMTPAGTSVVGVFDIGYDVFSCNQLPACNKEEITHLHRRCSDCWFLVYAADCLICCLVEAFGGRPRSLVQMVVSRQGV